MKKLKILIVEDDDISAFLLSKIIKDFSEVTLRAKNGLEGVNIYKNQNDIDLILMDVNMPIMDGFEATSIIRSLNKDVIIIIQSGMTEEDLLNRAMQSGCNEFISKPVTSEKILNVLKKKEVLI